MLSQEEFVGAVQEVGDALRLFNLSTATFERLSQEHAVLRAQLKPTHVSTVRGCARCGQDHPDLVFAKLAHASDEWTHWALCPVAHEPILQAHITDAECAALSAG